MNTKMRNTDNSLTRYALACGYVESATNGEKSVRLYREHHVYHVIVCDVTDSKWLTFDTLTEARSAYKKAKTKIMKFNPEVNHIPF